MTSDTPHSIVFAGFGATGKTTFLVALWHTVVHSDVPGALSLEKIYDGDREYITKRHTEWLSYTAVKRTNVDYGAPIRMTLRDTKLGRLLQLGIPDLSGETFKVQFEERRARTTLVDSIQRATGVALFINPQTVNDPTRIRDAWDAIIDEDPGDEFAEQPALARRTHQREDESGDKPEGPRSPFPSEGRDDDGSTESESNDAMPHTTDPAEDFDASLCCTQVKYVDLLQQLAAHGPSQPLRIAVIVSAMDTLDDTAFNDRPEEFIRIRMSMLDQYLRANSHLYEARIYGVSAQGGEYDTTTIEALSKLGPDRIRVCTHGQRDNDISRPVRWIAFGDE